MTQALQYDYVKRPITIYGVYSLHAHYTLKTFQTELTTVCGALIAHVSAIIIPIT